MSAICPSCGASIPDDAGACAACGTPAPARGDTVIEQLPPSETGPVPVSFGVAQPRWFGVAPAEALLLLAAAAVIAAIAAFATGRWPLGLVLLGLALLLLAGFAEAAKRKAQSRLATAPLQVFRSARERAGVAVESAAARSRAGRELARVRHELFELQQQRRTKIAALGEAAYAADAAAAAGLKDEIGELDRLAVGKEAEMQAIAERARQGIQRARLTVQKTEMLEPAAKPPLRGSGPGEGARGNREVPPARNLEPPQPAPEPAGPEVPRIPEPYPPPDEGTPPEPARIPEPYPPPDETTPPQPAPSSIRS